MSRSLLREVADILEPAQSVLFITGAGISADSGLPTYRGVAGLYNSAETEDGVAIEEALSGPMFAACPELTWKYMWQIGAACRGARPNPAHAIIANIEANRRDVWVVTQNVDGLHRAAGSRNLVEVHGSIDDLVCTACGREYHAAELLAGYGEAPQLPPRCSACRGILRPQVILFGEMLSPDVVKALFALGERSFDVIFAIGTTAVFPYIREPIVLAELSGIPTVEINPAPTSLSPRFRYCLRLGAAQAMQQLWDSDRG